ncbi:TPA: hypothetical protein DCW54_00340 [Candidatus Dependentiae bacterium]|nr:hypothetical protein [Candidatus Dependentiae bacterium]
MAFRFFCWTILSLCILVEPGQAADFMKKNVPVATLQECAAYPYICKYLQNSAALSMRLGQKLGNEKLATVAPVPSPKALVGSLYQGNENVVELLMGKTESLFALFEKKATKQLVFECSELPLRAKKGSPVSWFQILRLSDALPLPLDFRWHLAHRLIGSIAKKFPDRANGSVLKKKLKKVLPLLGGDGQNAVLPPQARSVLPTKTLEKVSFSNGTLFAVDSSENKIIVWDLKNKMPTILIGRTGKVCSGNFSADSSRMVTVADDRTVRVWDIVQGKHVVCVRYPRVPLCAAFNKDGKYLLVALPQGGISVLETKTGKELRTIDSPAACVAAFGLDASILVYSLFDAKTKDKKVIRVLHIGSGKGYMVDKGSEQPMGFVVSPDGAYVAISIPYEGVRICNLATGAVVSVLKLNDKAQSSVIFSADGACCATGVMQPYPCSSLKDELLVQTWEVKSGKQLFALAPQYSKAKPLMFGSDNKTLLTSFFEGYQWKFVEWELAPCVTSQEKIIFLSYLAYCKTYGKQPVEIKNANAYGIRLINKLNAQFSREIIPTQISWSEDDAFIWGMWGNCDRD